MNKDQLQEIKARCEAATPGPWYVWKELGRIEAKNPYSKGIMHIADGLRGYDHLSWHGHFQLGMDDETALKTLKANVDFIAYARQDIPALLAYIDELEARL